MDEARPQDEIIDLAGVHELGYVAGLMRQVTVHLDYEVGAQGEGPAEAVDARRAPAAPLLAEEELHPLILAGPLLNDL